MMETDWTSEVSVRGEGGRGGRGREGEWGKE